jgi:hypothetical protein
MCRGNGKIGPGIFWGVNENIYQAGVGKTIKIKSE